MAKYGKEMLDAIDAAIVAWEVWIRYGLDRPCPLCDIADYKCGGCPILHMTNKSNCIETPYYDTAKYQQNDADRAREADGEMLIFLKKLKIWAEEE